MCRTWRPCWAAGRQFLRLLLLSFLHACPCLMLPESGLEGISERAAYGSQRNGILQGYAAPYVAHFAQVHDQALVVSLCNGGSSLKTAFNVCSAAMSKLVVVCFS